MISTSKEVNYISSTFYDYAYSRKLLSNKSVNATYLFYLLRWIIQTLHDRETDSLWEKIHLPWIKYELYCVKDLRRSH